MRTKNAEKTTWRGGRSMTSDEKSDMVMATEGLNVGLLE